MARRALLAFVPLFAIAVGCQPSGRTSGIYPQPNLSGPVVVQSAPAAPAYIAPVAVNPTPARVQPAPALPASWRPRTAPRNWQWIVIHHSATPNGSAAAFDRQHKQNGWDELGYHFVIGNGTNTGDGAIEVGPRWPVQKWGAHAKTPDNRYNEQGIGICLVGNFETTRPTARQMQALARLVAHLSQTYRIPPERIIGHRNTGKATECPGQYLNIAEVRRQAQQIITQQGGTTTPGAPAHASTTELLGPAR